MEKLRLISFYLPQFHPIPENDAAWGAGYTEWTAVTRSRPLYPEHDQPRLPSELGFYDLRLPEVRTAQAELAAAYGVSAFCYHYFWFSGRRVLERPLDDMLASRQPDFPFCLCWANENWTRRWDSSESEILIAQQFRDGDDLAFIRSVLPYFADPRYVKVDGRPVLLVYRTDIIPDIAAVAAVWRAEARRAGHPGLYLVRCNTFVPYGLQQDPAAIGFDAVVEYPPHAVSSRNLVSTTIPKGTPFTGHVLDYRDIVVNAAKLPKPAHTFLRTVFPSWDNSPRRGTGALVVRHSSPSLYRAWLREMIDFTLTHYRGDERLVFINAWNEWGEGCHLEPDATYGRAHLEATRDARDIEAWRQRLLEGAGDAADVEALVRATAEDRLRVVALQSSVTDLELENEHLRMVVAGGRKPGRT